MHTAPATGQVPLPTGVGAWLWDTRIWRQQDGSLSPATALQQRETGLKRRFDDMMQAGFAAGSQQRFREEDVAAGVHANWMDPSPPRQHPMQRVAEAAGTRGLVTSQRAQQHLTYVSEPAVDDTTDPLVRGLQPPGEEDLQWVAAYRRASDKRLPKPLRVVGWQVLHAAVPTGAERVHAARNMQSLLGCCCHQPQCWQPQQQQPGQPGQAQQGQPPPQQQQQQPALLFFFFLFLFSAAAGASTWAGGSATAAAAAARGASGGGGPAAAARAVSARVAVAPFCWVPQCAGGVAVAGGSLG